MGKDRKICVGMIAGAHGVKGLVRLRSFTEDPETIGDFDELTDEAGEQSFVVQIKSAAKDYFIAEIKGVKNKEEADTLRGVKLYVTREALPKTGKSEFYEADLIGLVASDAQGTEYGPVRAVHDHGAGVFLEIGKGRADSFMLPFTDAFVPKIDIKGKKILVDIPENWLNHTKSK